MIDNARKLRRKAERKWRRTRSVEDFDAFKRRKNEATYLINKARREFYTQFMEENSENQGKLFKASKKILAVEDKLSFPDHLDKVKLANDIAKFFWDKG